jgi:eukaryotic-like serine/threonine-protein kinase
VFLTELRQAARQWESRGRPAGLLWRGEAADQAWLWMRHYRGALTPLQQQFLEAAFDVEARAGRLRQLLVAGVIVVLLVLVAAGGMALVLIRDAQKEAVAQAAMARQAKLHVREQLARVQAEERACRTAEQREHAAREAAEAAGATF